MSGTETNDDPTLAEDTASQDVVAEDVDPGPGLELVEPDPIQELQQQLDETTARLKTVSAAYQGVQAEMAAFKARLERQQKLKAELLKGDVVSKLFEPLENLKRSIDAAKRAGVDADTLAGLELVHKHFLEGFNGMGLEAIGAEGDRFDPSLHEALTLMPVDDPAMAEHVVSVFSVGYRIGTRVIRPARVIVGSFTEPAGEA